MKTFIGIDIGKNGAIAAIYHNGEVDKYSMPQKDGEIDQEEFANTLRGIIGSRSIGMRDTEHIKIAIEDVHSIYGSGAKANFQFGRSLGIVEGTLTAFELEYEKVQPKAWQKTAFAGIEKILKPGAKEKGKGVYDNKAMALQAAMKLYPDLDFRKSARATKPHDGIVDALLIANFLKNKYNQ